MNVVSFSVKYELTRYGKVLEFYVYGAYDEETLALLRSHHARVKHYSALSRKGWMFGLASEGKMYGVASRQASGGRVGDSYVPFPHLRADTVEEVGALFDHGTVCPLYVSPP